MALRMRIAQVNRNADGLWSAAIEVYDDADAATALANFMIQGSNREAIKNAIKARYTAIKQRLTAAAAARTLVSLALNDAISEMEGEGA